MCRILLKTLHDTNFTENSRIECLTHKDLGFHDRLNLAAILETAGHSSRNKVVHMIRSAKRVFYRNAIKSNLDNPQHLWRIIRNISPAKCSNLPGHLSGHILSDNTEIANQFNDHFANITSSVDLGDAAPLYPNWDYISEFVASKLPSSAP